LKPSFRDELYSTKAEEESSGIHEMNGGESRKSAGGDPYLRKTVSNKGGERAPGLWDRSRAGKRTRSGLRKKEDQDGREPLFVNRSGRRETLARSPGHSLFRKTERERRRPRKHMTKKSKGKLGRKGKA